MSSDLKLATKINYDIEEPNYKDKHAAINFNTSDNTSDNIVFKMLHGLLTHGNKSIIKVAANVARRATSNRLSNGIQAASNDVFDENGKQQNGSEGKSGPLLSGIAYCISSCSMILLNKVVLSSYGFDAGISLMLYQNFICVIIVVALGFFGVVSTEKLTWKLIRVWIPVNVIFVGMLVTGMYRWKIIINTIAMSIYLDQEISYWRNIPF